MAKDNFWTGNSSKARHNWHSQEGPIEYEMWEEITEYAYRLAKDYNVQLQIVTSHFDEETLSELNDDLDYAHENGSFEYKEPVA